jgi:hypothetical protein
MRDQEREEYPKHQPGHGTHAHHDPFEIQEEGELEDQPRHSPVHQREAATTPQLPHARGRKALIAGLFAGVIYEVARVTITLVNADLYRKGASYAVTDMPAGLAFTLSLLGALGYAVAVVAFFIVGLIIGRISVHRRWAFIGGFIGGLLCCLVSSILQQIPSYPSATHTGFSGGLVGISGGFAVLIIYSLIGSVVIGLICLFGAWLTTRRHPYYVGYAG